MYRIIDLGKKTFFLFFITLISLKVLYIQYSINFEEKLNYSSK